MIRGLCLRSVVVLFHHYWCIKKPRSSFIMLYHCTFPSYSLCHVFLQLQYRLGVDLRVQGGEYTDEYRLGFRHDVFSAEDAKSEVLKLFQESWERENGYVHM